MAIPVSVRITEPEPNRNNFGFGSGFGRKFRFRSFTIPEDYWYENVVDQVEMKNCLLKTKTLLVV